MLKANYIVLSRWMSVLLMATVLNSCEFGANAVDGSEIEPKIGTVFVYDNMVRDDFRAVQLGPKIQIRFLSKIANIGGREGVFGFESSPEGDLMFSDTRGEELEYYFQANRDFELPVKRNGTWIRLPRDGEEPVTATVTDLVYDFDPESPRQITRSLKVSPMGEFEFYVDGYHFTAIRVKVSSDYDINGFNTFGEIIHDEQELTFIKKLGVIAEKLTRDENGTVINHYGMTDIRF
jgi:hypothetical protein